MKNIGIIIGIIVIAGIAFFTLSPNKTEKSQEMINKPPEVKKEMPATEVSSTAPAPEVKAPEKNVKSEPAEVKQAEVKAGSYVGYAAEKIALAATGKVVLFFHAPWCPSCRALNGDIEKNVSTIPAGVTILKTDYDKETDLKKKYGVTSQHTLVQVDKDGNLIKKWSGGSKLENLLSQIQ